MKLALDSNILVYAEGVNGAARQAEALDLIERLPQAAIMVPVQALGELYNVLVNKGRLSSLDARQKILFWRDAFPLIDTAAEIMIEAVDLATDHRLQIWDAVMIAAAAAGKCRLLLSEDLQDGFTSRGITVANPFRQPRHRLPDAVLAGDEAE